MNLKDFNNKNIDIYLFSGTGNTYLVADRLTQGLKNNGFNVDIFFIEKTNPEKINHNNVLGLAFPVAAQGTYPFIWEFVKKLPCANKIPVFMIDTMLSYSGGIVGPLKKILLKKGYLPFSAREFLMPSNILRKNPMSEKDKLRIQKTYKDVDKYVDRLINGRNLWFDIPIYSDMMSIFSRAKFLWRFFNKIMPLSVNKDKCTKCGLCVKLCPVNNIKKNDIISIENNCCYCMRCYSYCPVEAIVIKHYNYKQYKAISVEKFLN